MEGRADVTALPFLLGVLRLKLFRRFLVCEYRRAVLRWGF